MTVDEIIDAAKARVAEFAGPVPTSRDHLMRRIGHRQAQIFARLAEVSPDYTGITSIVDVSPVGSSDLNFLDPSPERVEHVEIEDPGATDYETGQTVNVVSVQEPEAADAPRAVLRAGILTGYNGELTGVTSLAVYYARRPNPVTERASEPELHLGFHELFVLDCAKVMIRKAITLPAATRSDLLGVWDAEEAEMMADLEKHVERYNQAETSRFGRSARAITRLTT